MNQSVTNFLQFVKNHLLAICLTIASIALLVPLMRYKAEPLKRLLVNDNSKYESDIKELHDTLNKVYFKSEFVKDSLTNLISGLHKENNGLMLQINLLKFKQTKLKDNEKSIKYISYKNTSVDSALNTIHRIVTKYPIKVSNR